MLFGKKTVSAAPRRARFQLKVTYFTATLHYAHWVLQNA